MATSTQTVKSKWEKLSFSRISLLVKVDTVLLSPTCVNSVACTIDHSASIHAPFDMSAWADSIVLTGRQ